MYSMIIMNKHCEINSITLFFTYDKDNSHALKKDH